MKIFSRLTIIAIGFALLLSACVSVAPTNEKITTLMPDQIAKSIIANRAPSYWINSPFVYKEALCGGDKVSISFLDLIAAKYLRKERTLIVVVPRSKTSSFCVGQLAILQIDEQDADELVNALSALGARIKNVIKLDLPCSAYGACFSRTF